jgi:2-methylcitrate dehydratase PrpD
MMRCIDHPTMVKDGSGWGAMSGVSAAMLAHNGFTGAPALTVEGPEVADIWADLGENWLMMGQYFKPYAVCRWAQPAILGALTLQQEHSLPLERIKHIRVHTFHEATRLAGRRPQTTEEAQYSLPFPLAAALVYGRLGGGELSGLALQDPLVLRLAGCVELIEDLTCNARFPAERVARVQIETSDGLMFDSGEVQPGWDSASPPGDEELWAKFRWLAGESLPEGRAKALEDMIWGCADLAQASDLIELLAQTGV